MEAPELVLAARTLRRGASIIESDPLAYWTHAAPQLREATRLTTQVTEISVRAPAGGGKTEWGTAIVLGCAEGRRELDGIPLPFWSGRVDALELARDYNEQKLASQQTYLRLLGNWPHKIRWSGNDIVSSIRVRHADSSDDLATWSLIDFRSQENRHAGVGVRADIVRGDEPPYEEIWHEVRKAAHANRRALRLLTFTPIKRSEWWWLQREYGDGPRSRVRRVGKHWAEVRYSLKDNTILSAARKAELIDGYEREGKLIEARVHGDYVSTEGSCPFDEKTLFAMMEAWCTPPERRRITIPVEDPNGRATGSETVTVEVWAPPRQGLSAYQVIDPASGIDDNAHNPAGLHVSDDDSGDLLVRWNGYVAPYSLGALAAALGRHYGGAATDIEMKDHWGINVVRGYQEAGGTGLCYETRELRPEVWAKEVGFDVKAETRAIWIGCIQEWIAAFKAGSPYAICRSRAVFECLLDMELDDKDRPVAGPGIAHAEDFVLLGQALRRLDRPRHADPKLYVPGPTQAEIQMRTLFGPEPRARRSGSMLKPALRRPA
ncbi:MAG TPA: hypothetical protein VK505_04920 [Steroidobacteraceae bacterium]|nr:hypothetical protein [Steroidobacteraceae bacterium]